MRSLWKIFLGIFKSIWCTLNFVRECISNMFLIVFIAIMVGLYVQIQHIMTPRIEKSALLLDIVGSITDKPTIENNKLKKISKELFGNSKNKLQENSLFDVVNVLRQAKNDTNITGLVLSLKEFTDADQESLEYIGKVLQEFKESGKPVFAIGDNYNQYQYFLASYADKIYLSPQGSVDLHGISVNNLYYKSFLKKLKIKSHIFRVGHYKSAVEPFLRNNMSPAARKSTSRWTNKLWSNYLETVASNRNLSVSKFFPSPEKMLLDLHKVHGNTAKFALEKKWIDEIASKNAIEEILIKKFGWDNRKKDFKKVSIYDYPVVSTPRKKKEIAVILVNGAIFDGVETSGMMNSSLTVNKIRYARLNPNIKAIVLRVNSPGGSVRASEMIRSELYATRTSGKPIVVSMGGIAASGGYWISTPANYIVAGNSTLTGSIGIFGIINTIENTLKSVGIYSDGVATSILSDVSLTKRLPKEVAEIVKLNIKNNYRYFLSLVSKSRSKPIKEIEKVSQGRVWIGIDALKYGLIDKLGNFDDALNKAAEIANLGEYSINWCAEEKRLTEIFIAQIKNYMNSFVIENLVNLLSRFQIQFNLKEKDNISKFHFVLNDPKYCYAFYPFYGKLLK